MVFEVNKKNGIAIEFKIDGKHETYKKPTHRRGYYALPPEEGKDVLSPDLD